MKSLIKVLALLFLFTGCSRPVGPVYRTNEVPLVLLETWQSEDVSEMIVFPSEGAYRLRYIAPSRTTNVDIHASLILKEGVGDRPGVIVPLLAYSAHIFTDGIQVSGTTDISLSGTAAATLTFSSLHGDIVYSNKLEGQATFSGSVPGGPLAVSVATNKGVFIFRFTELSEY